MPFSDAVRPQAANDRTSRRQSRIAVNRQGRFVVPGVLACIRNSRHDGLICFISMAILSLPDSMIDWYEVFSGRYADGIFKNMIKGDSNKPGMETILNIISMGSTFRT